MHNLAEMCFQHVVKTSSLQQDRNLAATQKGKPLVLPKKLDMQVQLCVQKYMETVQIVQRVTEEELVQGDSVAIKEFEDDENSFQDEITK